MIKIYFSINLFLAGYCFAEKFNKYDSKTEKIKTLLYVLFTMFCGIVYISCLFIFYFIERLFLEINNYFQLSSYFDFFVRKTWSHNLDEEQLKKLNMLAKGKINSKKLNDRIFKHVVKLLNQRNSGI